jgi:hypothetical protein
MEGRRTAQFSAIEEAVDAVDYELEKRGRAVALSARPGAAWRREDSGGMPVADALQQAVWNRVKRNP